MIVFVYCSAVNNDKQYYTHCVTCQEFWTFRMSFYYWNTQRTNCETTFLHGHPVTSMGRCEVKMNWKLTTGHWFLHHNTAPSSCHIWHHWLFSFSEIQVCTEGKEIFWHQHDVRTSAIHNFRITNKGLEHCFQHWCSCWNFCMKFEGEKM